MLHDGLLTIVAFRKQKPLWLIEILSNTGKDSDDEILTEQLAAARDPTIVEISNALPEITDWKSVIKH